MLKLKREKNLDVVIGTQFLMIDETSNIGELQEVIKKLGRVKPDYLSIKPYSDHPKSRKNLGVELEKYQKLERDLMPLIDKAGFKVVLRRDTVNRVQEGNEYPECYGLPFISLVSSTGDVFPCNLFYDNPEYSYGNLTTSSFREIWESEKRKEVVQRLKIEGTKDCRSGCRCDAGNRYLQRIRNPQPHDNFT